MNPEREHRQLITALAAIGMSLFIVLGVFKMPGTGGFVVFVILAAILFILLDED